jgi:site-specific recombinase XerC
VGRREAGRVGRLPPHLFTRTALETYLRELEGHGYSVSHRSRVKSVAGGFAGRLIEEKGLLSKNPARGVEVPAQALPAPRRLSPDQRYVLRNLVERDGKVRSEALFSFSSFVSVWEAG